MMSKPGTAVAAALGVALLLGASGCGSGSSDAGSAPASITLWSRGANEAINQSLADAWNASHTPKVKLLPVPDAEYTKKLAAAVAAGNPPDVATLDVVAIPDLMRGGVLTDITERAKGLSFYDQLAKSYVAHSTLDGKVYALPENIDASTLFYNKDLFARAGLDPERPPTTFAELEAAADKITALGGGTTGFYFAGQCTGCNAYTFSPLVWASGGDFVDEGGQEATLTSPGVVDSLALYKRLWEKGDVAAEAKTDTGANWVAGFGTGKIGMVGLGAFAIAQMESDYPDVHYGVAPLPGKDGGVSSFTGGDVIAIPEKSPHEDAAWKFVEWTLGEDAQVGVYAKSGSLVARSDLVDNEFSDDPNVLAENKAALIGRLPTWYPNNGEIDAPTGPFSTAFQEVVFSGADPAKALAKADAEFQRLLDQG